MRYSDSDGFGGRTPDLHNTYVLRSYRELPMKRLLKLIIWLPGSICLVLGLLDVGSFVLFRSGAVPVQAEVVATIEKSFKIGTPPGVIGRHQASRGDLGGFSEYSYQDATVKILAPTAPSQHFVLHNQHNLIRGLKIPVWYNDSRAEVREDITWSRYIVSDGILLVTGLGFLVVALLVPIEKRRTKR